MKRGVTQKFEVTRENGEEQLFIKTRAHFWLYIVSGRQLYIKISNNTCTSKAYLLTPGVVCKVGKEKRGNEGKVERTLFYGTFEPKDIDGRELAVAYTVTYCPECVQVAFEVRTLKSQLVFFCTCNLDSPNMYEARV